MSGPVWRQRLNECLQKSMKENKDSISYPLATVDSLGHPQNRFVVHRGFVNERRKDEDPSDNDASEDFTSNVLLTTTDARGPKANQIKSFGSEGCPVEISWWMAPVSIQFRIKGRAFLLSPPSNSQANTDFPSKRLGPPLSESGSKSKFDWEAERIRIFAKMSPPLKASFLRPTPGTPLKDTDVDYRQLPQELKDGQKEEEKKALENFALIAIEPFEVDLADLADLPNERRVYKKSDDWKEVAVAP